MSLLLASAGAAVAGAAAGPGLAVVARSTLRRGRVDAVGVIGLSGAAACSAAAIVARWSADGPLLLPGLLLFAVAGVTLSAVDLAEHRLPDVLVLPAAAGVTGLLVVGSLVAGHPGAALGALMGALGLSALYLLLAVLARGRFGMGDVKFGLVAGAVTGVLGLHVWSLGLLAGVVVNGLVAVVALLARRSLTATIPFGPSIYAGVLLAVLLG